MNFLKRLLGKEEARSPERTLPNSREITTRLKLAAALRLNKEYELALVECNEVLQLQPTNHLAYHIRALTKYDLDDQDGAIRDWNRFKSLQEHIR